MHKSSLTINGGGRTEGKMFFFVKRLLIQPLKSRIIFTQPEISINKNVFLCKTFADPTIKKSNYFYPT